LVRVNNLSVLNELKSYYKICYLFFLLFSSFSALKTAYCHQLDFHAMWHGLVLIIPEYPTDLARVLQRFQTTRALTAICGQTGATCLWILWLVAIAHGDAIQQGK
jgi:hypothetical protein